MSSPSRRDSLVWGAASLLVLLTAATYRPTLRNGLVNWDDLGFIVKQPAARDLSWDSLKRLFVGDYGAGPQAYYPVFRLSLAVDRALWGAKPAGYHLENLLLHAVNAILVLFLGLRWSRLHEDWPATLQVGAATLAAALFAVHPVNVEPVAWVCGRKVLLASLFSLTAVHLHVGEASGWVRRSLSVVCFALACLCNAMAASLPLLLMAHERLVGRQPWLRAARHTAAYWPIAIGVVALRLGRVTVERDELLPGVTLVGRAAGAGAAVWEQVRALAIPHDLCNLYEPTRVALADLRVWCCLALVVGSFVVVLALHRRPLTRFFLTWFWIALTPSLVRNVVRADRHLYLTGLGLFWLVALLVARLCSRPSRGQRAALMAVALAAVGWLAALSRAQCAVWRNSETLWRHTVRVNPGSAIAHNNLGVALILDGREGEALAQFRRARNLNPAYAEPHINLALTHESQGRTAAALEEYGRALALEPDSPEAHFNLADLLSRQSKWEQAIDHYRAGLASTPLHTEGHVGLGVALAVTGRAAEAIDSFRRALRRDQQHLGARLALARLLQEQGRPDEALRLYEDGLLRHAADATFQHDFGAALANIGDLPGAVAHFEQAVRLRPHYALAYRHLGLALLEQGRNAAAVSALTRALQVDPVLHAVHLDLARAYQRLGQPDEARRHMEAAKLHGLAPGGNNGHPSTGR